MTRKTWDASGIDIQTKKSFENFENSYVKC